MTNPYRAMCAELSELDGHCVVDCTEEWADAMCRLRAALAQPEPAPEGPGDEELDELYFYIDARYVASWRHYARAALAKWGTLTPQPVAVSERLPGPEDCLDEAWEVHDAAGDWQAGGSANSLEDVQREGNRYLQTYSQDGPHKLIIQRHCVSTIEEVTND